MNSITLSRKQVKQLNEIVERFTETEHFIVDAASLSGIGQNITVRFDLFETSDTKIDITDVGTW